MRDIDPAIIEYFETRQPFTYAHLIEFERPKFLRQDTDKDEREFVYLTDSSHDEYFGEKGTTKKYRANRVLSVPPISEYSEARATAIDIQLDASAIGSYIQDFANILNEGDNQVITFSKEVYNSGFVEADKIIVTIDNTFYDAEILKFPAENKIRVLGKPLPEGNLDCQIELASEELMSILQDKENPEYVSFINREVIIYKTYYDVNGDLIGTPYYLYKGIIQDVDLEDDDGSIKVNWTLNSHWGDFSEVRGRLTSDESHRALDERGVPQPQSAIKAEYAYDKGFIHSDTAVHLEATYTVQVEKQDVKFKKGFFGIGAKTKVKKYFVEEGRQTELDFQLQNKTLDVIYGVRPVEGNPIFADTNKTNSSEVYVAYALCEGEIGAIYDFIIADKTLICNNEADFDARSSQTQENTIDVVCRGRADRGDVLEGIRSTSSTSIPFFDTYQANFFNEQSLSFRFDYSGFSQPLNTYSGSVGILHENSVKLEEPIDMTLSFYSGKPDQAAAPNLVDISKNGGFKVQSDYWTGDNKLEYWGPNHRLLDTAYVVIKYTIAENETTIPNIKTILKGSLISCYNYDFSYQHDEKKTSESPATFKSGQYVSLYQSNGTLITNSIRIQKAFTIRNDRGELENRFRFVEEPDLGYQDGIPTITEFYMQDGSGNRWTMVTFNHVFEENSVPLRVQNNIDDLHLDPNTPWTALNFPDNSVIPDLFNGRTYTTRYGSKANPSFRLEVY